MKIFGFNITKDKIQGESYQAYSSPFQKVGSGNLSLPNVKGYVTNSYVPFGAEPFNMFPQLLNQLYFTSPLHAAIIDFKVNAILGGGFELDKGRLDTKSEFELVKFERKTKFKQFVPKVLRELLVHNRVYFIGTKTKEGATFKNFIGSEKIRVNKDKTVYYISNDWSVMEKVQPIKRYKDSKVGDDFIYCYENESLGQDIYALPTYTSANNWIFLDGEMSFLQKSNILNSIFPSFILNFPKMPSSEEEKEAIKSTIEGLKGAGNAGKSAAFFGAGKENVPEIISMPTNNNDSLFYQTTESIDSKICQAHTIDPILMGIRVSGKLGSGSDIKQSYIIFEKNVVMPLREEVENLFNDLFMTFGLDVTLSINDFQIIGDKIVDKTE